MLKLLFVVVDGRTKNTEQENDVGNDRGCNSVAPRLRFLFFLSSLNFFNFWRHFSVIAYTTTDTQFGPHHQKDWNIMLFLLKIKVNLNFINLNYAPMNFLYVRVCVNIIFLKDYDFELSYHPDKANVVTNALSRKFLHMSALMVVSRTYGLLTDQVDP